MSSARRIAASRANGATSRGPKTPEGKRRSAMNDVRHGLLAKTVLLDNESPEAFEEFCRHFHQSLDPADPVETALLEELAVAVWRTRRAWAIETTTLETALANQPPAPNSRVSPRRL
jgi:hypothetical protein